MTEIYTADYIRHTLSADVLNEAPAQFRLLRCCVPEGGHEVAGGPAHDEAPLWVCAPLTHFLHAVGHPHLTHSDLGLHLKMGGRSTGDKVLSVKRSL